MLRPPLRAGVARAVALAACLTVACSSPDVSADAVLLDGLFDEWTEAATLVDDPPDATDATVDLLSVQALDDPTWLYLAIDVGNEVAIQSLPGTLRLLLDADADRSTGTTSDGMEGVDLFVDLSQTWAPTGFGEGRGAGFALRVPSEEGTTREVGRQALGLMAAPTWAAPRFELRLSRLGAEDAPPLGDRIRVKGIYLEGGTALDETDVGSYAFRSRAERGERDDLAATPDAGTRLERAKGSTRVVTWNVSSRSFTLHRDAVARILAALGPDVVLLDELPGDVTRETLGAFFESPPLSGLGRWGVVLSGTGGVQRTAVAARDREIAPASALAAVPYPDGALEALARTARDDVRALLDDEGARGVSAVGARVEIGAQRVLFVSVDLRSGGWPGSPRDRLRTLQAETIRARVAAELSAGPAPVVIGGDLNLVGSRRPLFALVRGLDVDGSDLVPVDAERLGERTLATWRNPRDAFAPGRLDFLLIPDGAATVANAFVFATEDLDDASLAEIGLDRDATGTVSDHLVVVADLTFRGPSAAASKP